MSPLFKRLVVGLLGLGLLGAGACTPKKTDHQKITQRFFVVYTSNVLGEIEPCG